MAKYKKYLTIGWQGGKRIRKWFYGDTKAELDLNIKEYFAEMQRVSNPSFVTFENYARNWFKTYKDNRSNNTKEMYINALNKCGYIAYKPVKHITKTDCQKIINDNWDSPRIAEILRMMLKQIFNCAISDGIIYINPAMALDIPKHKAKEKRLITEEEARIIQQIPFAEMDKMLVTILMVFGLRPGEALALQKKDFDYEENVLHITKAIGMTTKTEPIIKSTKTGANRDIPIPDAIKPLLNAYFRSNKAFFLFYNKKGAIMSKSSYSRLSERIIKQIDNALGYKSKITLYSFRHYRASQLYYLCQQGKISTKMAAYLMGHSEQVFLQIYSHIDESKENLSDLYKDIVI